MRPGISPAKVHAAIARNAGWTDGILLGRSVVKQNDAARERIFVSAMLLTYSGGLDSTVLLYAYPITHAVYFRYGSKHSDMELACAESNARRRGVRLIVCDLPWMREILGSSLLVGGEPVPEGHYTDASMRSTVVPFRNGVLLASAVAIAESCGCGSVAIANHAGDHAIYPDCRPEFVNAMSLAASAGTYAHIQIFSPFVSMTKREIAERGRGIVNFAKTWSCYKGGRFHCGRCGTCVERREALEGFDPTIYEV